MGGKIQSAGPPQILCLLCVCGCVCETELKFLPGRVNGKESGNRKVFQLISYFPGLRVHQWAKSMKERDKNNCRDIYLCRYKCSNMYV